jgi:microcystin-dependent protein
MRKTSSLPNSAPITLDQPYGGILDQATGVTGTPVVEATYSDFIQSLWQFFRVTGTTPNELAENTTNGFQLFDSIEKYLCPVGTIKIWPSDTIPDGWVLCDGTAYSTTEYADLYALIGTNYGYGAGTFLVPDFSDRFILSKGTSYPTLGAKAGAETHTLTIAETPAHYHLNGVADDKVASFVYGGVTTGVPGSASESLKTEVDSRIYQGKTSNIGSGTGHNNMPPYIVMNFIIKAKYGKDL